MTSSADCALSSTKREKSSPFFGADTNTKSLHNQVAPCQSQLPAPQSQGVKLWIVQLTLKLRNCKWSSPLSLV